MQPLPAFVQTDTPWLLETVEALVRAESPSTDKAAVDRCGAEIARRLAASGADVRRIPQAERGDHLRASFEGAGDQVMILGHFDTVWAVGQIERMPFRIADGRLHGPGVYDMKSGIAVAMVAMRALTHLQQPKPRVVMLLTTDEEIGSGSSRRLIEEEARRSRAVLVLEPPLPGGGVKTSRKGAGDFELTVHGMSSHAGLAPAQGANALHELAHQILAIQALQDLERGVSVNVTVASAGSRANVIPDLARVTIDVRVVTMDDARTIEAEMRRLQPQLRGTRITVEGGLNRPPMERTPQVLGLYSLARECARELGKELAEGGTGGGSDGNFTAAAGVPTLDGLGPEGDGAHALQEHVLLEDLPWRAAFLAALLGRLAPRPAR